MNRLILIGNGFDLAHGLKTSYCDFITDYIARTINTFYETNSYNDILLSINFRYAGKQHSAYDVRTVKSDEAIKYLSYLSDHEYFIVKINSTFLWDTINKISELNWVDLENDYFEKLVNCKVRTGFDINNVNKINAEFDFLKKELELYLLRIQSGNKNNYSQELTDLFYGEINSSEIITCAMDYDVKPTKVLFLTFNYTNTIENYLPSTSKQQFEVNYIHGKLGDSENPIIFGFGDEYNKSYLQFEEEKSSELLTHIKSFGYFGASNYHDLMKFLEADDFQVYTFGHSLGLSDRTMLKEIFENENCKSIKIFYHKDRTDFINKTYDISKHFTNKGLMRKKISPFTKSLAMPQPNDKY